MIDTIDPSFNIERAHRIGRAPLALPFSSFAQFFLSTGDRSRTPRGQYLTYYDDSELVRAYTYKEFGTVVGKIVTFMRDHLGIQRGDRIAILLFNHDSTVAIYFAAWVLGAVVVPIDINESETRRLYILEHSEARVAFCWEKSMKRSRIFGTGFHIFDISSHSVMALRLYWKCWASPTCKSGNR